MHRITTAFVLLAWAFVGAFLSPAYGKDPVPAAAFGALPQIWSVKISPDGHYVAAIQTVSNRPAIVVYDMSAGTGAQPRVLSSGDWTVESLLWVKNDRLVAIVSQRANKAFEKENRVPIIWSRAIAMNHDGGQAAILMANQRAFKNNTHATHIIDVDLDDPKYVFATLWTQDGPGSGLVLNVMKVDVMTGQADLFMAGNPDTIAWLMDGHGGMLARVDRTNGPLLDHVKLYQNGAWHDGETVDASGSNDSGIISLTIDGRSLAAFDNSGPAATIVSENLSDHTKSQLFSYPGYDVYFAEMDEWTRRVIGARYIDDRSRWLFFDAGDESLMRGLESAFPNMSIDEFSFDRTKSKVLIKVGSDRSPPSYYFLDRTTHQATIIGQQYPSLKSEDLGEVRSYPYTASDGLKIPAYITLPPGREPKNLPMIVMPHAGPGDRDSIRFDWLAQFLANRGYVVLQPNYRGSYGYGAAFYKAGLKQWGLRMQDDISDGVRRAIADGIADPKRICIFGSGYGGYAALAGAQRTPDLYACAASLDGISDLHLYLESQNAENDPHSKTMSFWSGVIGDRFADDAQLRATSPDLNVEVIKCPILLLHNTNSSFSPISQSESMDFALRKAGKSVEFVRLQEEANTPIPTDSDNTMPTDTRVRMLELLQNFFATNIGR